MATISAMPDGSTIADAPRGSGVALRTLRERQRVRYLGTTSHRRCCDAQAAAAKKLRLDQVELVQADVESAPRGRRKRGSVPLLLQSALRA
jgi:hypothetical protein